MRRYTDGPKEVKVSHLASTTDRLRKKPPSRAKDKGIPKVFDCPFCVHTGSVECRVYVF